MAEPTVIERPERMPPLEPPVIVPDASAVSPADQPQNRMLDPDDIARDPFATINRELAALIAKEKAEGGQRSFVYPSKVWEYPWALSHHLAERSPAGEMVLDAGCGVSTLPIYLASKGATVVALDSDVRWLTMEARAAEFHRAPVVPVLMDMVALGFPDATFDRVYCISVLEHIELAQQPVAMLEMARVLKPGGVLYLTVDYDAEERRSGDDVVYDRLALQRNAIAPSGLEVEGSTRYGTDDWDREHARMREFKLHTFAAMGVVLRKPVSEGPESSAAIARRRARAIEAQADALTRVVIDADADLTALEPGALVVAPTLDRVEATLAALPSLETVRLLELPLPPGTWNARHAQLRQWALSAHALAPELPVCAFADAADVTDGRLDGAALDAYGVLGASEVPPDEISLLRPCFVRAAGE